MALPALRATLLLTTATAAAGTLLYENHEPFRTWADDVSGRAQAAWIGLKADLAEIREDIEGHARRRHAPMGANAGQWEGVGAVNGEGNGVQGPWRRGRRRPQSRGSGEKEQEKKEDEKGEDEKAATTATDTALDGELRKRTGNVHASQFSADTIAVAATDADAILNSSHASHPSQASTDTLRSAEEEALHEAAVRGSNIPSHYEESESGEYEHASGVLTPTTTSTETLDWNSDAGNSNYEDAANEQREYSGDGEETDAGSMSVVSAPSEMGTGTGVMTPTSGVVTPTSSEGEVVDLEEVGRRVEGSDSEGDWSGV